jgi:hypothetical protein
MNLGKIKEVVNGPYAESIKEDLILKILSDDKDVIPTMMKILQHERDENSKLISDSNLELSRALVAFDGEKIVAKSFIVGEIKKHFIKWQHKVRCCFKFKDLP